MKKIIKSVLIFTMTLSLEVSAFASEIDNEKNIEPNNVISECGFTYEVNDEFSNMSVEELNEFIHAIMVQEKNGINPASLQSSAISETWKAAAHILILNGYECTGALLLASANKVDSYTESFGGVFEDKIKPTKKYKDFLSAAKGQESYTENIIYGSA